MIAVTRERGERSLEWHPIALFGNDGGGNFVAYDPATGRPLWHAGLGVNSSNGPQTFLVDGRQYVVVGAGDALYAFALPQ